MSLSHVFNETWRIINEYDLSSQEVKLLQAMLLQENTRKTLANRELKTQAL
jgi:hypothetical protein